MGIDVSDPLFWFSFFYVLSFGVTFLLFIFCSNRLKIPLRSVLLLLTTVTLCTIIGSRLSTIPYSEWGQVIYSGRFEEYHGRFAIGGILFGFAGLVSAQYILRINKSILNLYAWISPVGFGIQKLGCFFNGCCYGKQSDLPWSIQYPIGTNAHYHQLLGGLIEKNAAHTLNIHPVQLYETILFFVISFIVWKSLKYWKKAWSALIFSLILFFIFRFSVEFYRDPSSSVFESNYISGLSMIQWFLLGMGIVCFIILLFYEHKPQSVPVAYSKDRPFINNLIFILSVSSVIYAFRGLFTQFELISLNLKFIPAIILTAFYVFNSIKIVRIRLATASLLILPLFLMSQTFLPDSIKTLSYNDFYSQVKSYKRIDLNSSFGNFYSNLKYNPQKGECGTTYTTEDYNYLYWIMGGGISEIKKEGKSVFTKGINLYGGIFEEKNITKQWEKKDFLLAVNPYIKYDLRWVGFGIGAHVGNIRWVPLEPIDQTTFDRGSRFSPVLPEVLFRVGRRDILDLQYSYGFNSPTSIPVLLNEFSIGSGFGFRSDYNLRVGTAFSQDYSTTFISAEALIGNNLGLTLKYNFGGDNFNLSNDYYYYNVERRGRFLFGANYRFGFKK